MQDYISLNQNKDFLRLYNRGKSSAKSGVVVYGSRNRNGICRVGITTSKKIGNAVERNRSRRVIRAAWQSVIKSNEIDGNWDFVLVARNRTKLMKSTKIERQLLDAMRNIGAIK